MASHYGEDIDIESEVVEFRRSSFFVEHRVTKKGQPMLKGFETRLWTVRDPDTGRMKSGTMPAEIIAAFQKDTPPL